MLYFYIKRDYFLNSEEGKDSCISDDDDPMHMRMGIILKGLRFVQWAHKLPCLSLH